MARVRPPRRPPAAPFRKRSLAGPLAPLTLAAIGVSAVLPAVAVAGSGGVPGLLPLLVVALGLLAPAAWLVRRGGRSTPSDGWQTPLLAFAALPFLALPAVILSVALGDTVGDRDGLATLAARSAPFAFLAALGGSVAVGVTGLVAAWRART